MPDLEVLRVTLETAVRDITAVTKRLETDYVRWDTYKEIKKAQDLQFQALNDANQRTQADVDALAEARNKDKEAADQDRRDWNRTRSTNNITILIFGASTLVGIIMNTITLLKK